MTVAMDLGDLLPLAQRAAVQLKARRQTLAVLESSAGGLITAALLAVPGASAYCRGGLVVYTRRVLLSLKGVDEARLQGLRSVTEGYALFQAGLIREQFVTDWGIGETGAAGPAGNSYGDPAGSACVAVSGAVNKALRIDTGSAGRIENMHAFAAGALRLLAEVLESA